MIAAIPISVTLIVPTLLFACQARQAADGGDDAKTEAASESSGTPMTSPTFATQSWVVLDGGTETELGFTPVEAGAAFSGTYVSSLRYVGGGVTNLTIRVSPNGEPLFQSPESVRYTYSPAIGRARGVEGGVETAPAVTLLVDVEFATDDGSFDESIEARLHVFSLEFARLQGALRLPGDAGLDSSWADELEGTFSYDPTGYDDPLVYLYTDLYSDGDDRATSGWVGNVVNLPNKGRLREDLARWGVCLLRGIDAGAVDCSDAGP